MGLRDIWDDMLFVSESKTNNKKDTYIKIQEQYKATSQEILVVGDSYENDILPALELGYSVIYITDNNKEKLICYSNIIEALKEI